MSRFLFRRRLAIVALLAAVVVLIPLIGWVSHTLALKVARDVRPPARIRYTYVAKTGQIRVESESDGAEVVIGFEANDGTVRTTSYSGGGLPGDWEYGAVSTSGFDGTVDREAAPESEWVALRPGDVIRLADVTTSDGAPASLTAWCLPDDLTSGPFGVPEEQYEDFHRRREEWMAAHPPTQP